MNSPLLATALNDRPKILFLARIHVQSLVGNRQREWFRPPVPSGSQRGSNPRQISG